MELDRTVSAPVGPSVPSGLRASAAMAAHGLIPSSDDRTIIHCLYCGKPQEVAKRALTISCRHCNRSLRLEDLRFKEYQARRSIETTGTVTVEKRGHVVADKIHCGSLIVRGKVKGNVLSRGLVWVAADAEIRGDVTAAALKVEPGAVLDGKYDIRPENGVLSGG